MSILNFYSTLFLKMRHLLKIKKILRFHYLSRDVTFLSLLFWTRNFYFISLATAPHFYCTEQLILSTNLFKQTKSVSSNQSLEMPTHTCTHMYCLWNLIWKNSNKMYRVCFYVKNLVVDWLIISGDWLTWHRLVRRLLLNELPKSAFPLFSSPSNLPSWSARLSS